MSGAGVLDWDDIVAELVIAGLGSWDEIARGMTLPRLYALRRCWRRRARPAGKTEDLSSLIGLLGGPGPIR